jgi:hypothetical protein
LTCSSFAIVCDSGEARWIEFCETG